MAAYAAKMRSLFEAAFSAGLAAVDPRRAVMAASENVPWEGPVTLIALGKAAPAMAQGAVEVLGDRLVRGVVVAQGPPGIGQAPVGQGWPPGLRYLEGGHPIPNVASLRAGRHLMVEAARATGTLLVLISGGASALAEVPVDGLTLADLVTTYRQLFRAGLPIEQINTVRRHLSALKNGGLLATTRARTVTFLIADVVGADASAIGSGPTLADRSTPAEAFAIVAKAGVVDLLPQAVVDALCNPIPRKGRSPLHSWAIVADGRDAARAAVEYLRHDGFRAELVPDPITGDAAEQGRRMATTALAATVTVGHGETVVKVRGENPGGRNQHAALAAAIALEGHEAVFAALATDGRDGLTDSAGAIVDGESCHRLRSAAMNPEEMLAGCRSHEALAASCDLVITGPTGNNVADIWMAWRQAR